MKDHREIPGWCDFEELYASVVKFANPEARFVEVGCWQGRSAAFMCGQLIARKREDIEFFCVDTWKGSVEHQGEVAMMGGDVFPVFTENMKEFAGHYQTIRLPSVDAAKRFANDTLDFVFIDASHQYQDVADDIEAWAGKVKPGGILAGHDLFFPDVLRCVRERFPIFKVWNTSWLIVKPE